ncbi:hypothetical protein PoB_001853500 [Plakobranchus ocellatus]|uniref:Uncharacterized protein n=1 Tax=Plakobranchus ocellatus TaxID=259542 RepID=A0AAV3Z925_9GAST|nr:hypothetical protein PoB_001853500 [Plakobranchus ocellatus]
MTIHTRSRKWVFLCHTAHSKHTDLRFFALRQAISKDIRAIHDKLSGPPSGESLGGGVRTQDKQGGFATHSATNTLPSPSPAHPSQLRS